MRLCLLGDPVAHSRSPAIHAAALAAVGIAGSYEARRVDGAGLAAAIAELRAGSLDGANVTMPHKTPAHRACEALDDDAARAGAVNTLAVRDGRLQGWNTDVAGMRDLLAALPSAPVLVLGAGGAAAAAIVAASGSVRVSARSPQRTAALAGVTGAEPHPWGEPWPGAVVVNATPLGMHGEDLPSGVLRGAAGLLDLAYGPQETPAVRRARADGLPCADGVEALVAQAAVSFTLWTGVPAPRPVMVAAARQFPQGP